MGRERKSRGRCGILGRVKPPGHPPVPLIPRSDLSPPPRFRCPLPPSSSFSLTSLFSFPLCGKKSACMCAHRNPCGIRGRGRLKEAERVGFIYAGRQVGKIRGGNRFSPFAPPPCKLRLQAQVLRTGPGRIACCSRGRTQPRTGGSVRVPALHTNCAITCNGARKK